MSAIDAPERVARASGQYDPGLRRRSVRKGRERGCWVYIPAVELQAAGFGQDAPPPWYRLFGHRRSKRAGSVVVSLYREL